MLRAVRRRCGRPPLMMRMFKWPFIQMNDQFSRGESHSQHSSAYFEWSLQTIYNLPVKIDCGQRKIHNILINAFIITVVVFAFSPHIPTDGTPAIHSSIFIHLTT